jgi:hypothetical protein
MGKKVYWSIAIAYMLTVNTDAGTAKTVRGM